MSKCDVGSTWKSKRSYWTLLDPKYCAERDADSAPPRANASVIARMTPLVTTSPVLVKGPGEVDDSMGCARVLADFWRRRRVYGAGRAPACQGRTSVSDRHRNPQHHRHC